MPAYLITHGDVHDAAYEEYQHRAAPTVAEHGGRHLARAGAAAPLQGGWPSRLVPVGFPGYPGALRFDHSPGHREGAAVPQRCSRSALAILDGG